MTPLEQRAVAALVPVRTGCFNNAGRFIDWLALCLACDAAKPLEEKHKEGLWGLVWRFRRQIGDEQLIRVAQFGGDVEKMQRETIQQIPLPLGVGAQDGR